MEPNTVHNEMINLVRLDNPVFDDVVPLNELEVEVAELEVEVAELNVELDELVVEVDEQPAD